MATDEQEDSAVETHARETGRIEEVARLLFASTSTADGAGASARLLLAVFQASRDAIFVKSLDGHYLLINEVGAGMLGKTVEEVVGQDDFGLFTRESAERMHARDQAILQSQTSIVYEDTSTANGRTYTWSSSKTPLRDFSGKVVALLGVSRDVSEDLRVRDALHSSSLQLKLAKAEIARSARLAALGELGATLAHEVRNPLGAIFNALLLLKRKELESPVKALLDIIREEGEHLERLVRELIDFARPPSVQREEQPLGSLLERALKACLDELPTDHRVATHLTLEPVSLSAPVDARLLHQAFWNLFQNALQAMPEGGELKVEGHIENGSAIVLTVTDSGRGIPPDSQGRVFEPFFTTRARGTGLGLSVVKRIIEDHGGSIVFRSVPDAGTTFTVRLPVTTRPA